MVAEYLSRREKEIESRVRLECAAELTKERELLVQERQKNTDLRLSNEKLTIALHRLAEALGRANKCYMALRCWKDWEAFTRCEKIASLQDTLEQEYVDRQRAAAVVARWREVAAAARERRRAENSAREALLREEELKGEIEALKEALRKESEARRTVEDKSKADLVKSVAALNREAILSLKGEDGEDDAAAIEEILSSHSPVSRKSSTMLEQSQGASGRLDSRGSLRGSRAVEGASSPPFCPVHGVDEEGNFYHKCYNPNACAYGPSSTRQREFEPFVVEAQHASRTVSAGVPSYRASRPPPATTGKSSTPLHKHGWK
ncbi:hypothetical protein AGDE_13299 [Angomonas deanei]|nr:hypothetical protein AGDE_13299 [Angomonas deanei]|eukprot:EPY22471.1 hypothetical protein AGDE_13299 [Angomonas deanei]